MKKVLFLAVVAAMVVVSGCTPSLKPRTLGAEEQQWADYLQGMYPGWKVPATFPQSITLSSDTVPYSNLELPDQPNAGVNEDLPTIPEGNIVEETPAEKEAPAETEVKTEVKTDAEAETPLVEEEKVEFTEYVVEKNDSLSSIAKKVYGNGNKYIHIYKANEDVLKDPNKLYPGMKLKIPAQK
jgi:nucleoid-associated protein YgaU